ncbi:hypothetical protein BGZ61DRAFT_471400 [Ilyonectria robusta]|uniref:uncharacterized protein n=1 Tax=Ilyonectria robusta TaxID=1079257 RepID=UPI001E8EB894|nr:uncharacterized protein BGZ61DRAFT_471400 [Ilyonectria robusta]KAH8738029.1 hypothetical protein BGZ61DRAFT_471400 [Ilyonectria robusta]
MPDGHRSLEANRLEIVLIAAGILVLVSVLGILILLGVGLRPPAAAQDTENGQRWTAWGGAYNEPQDRGPIEPYHDCDNTFISSVRRGSRSLAEEFKQELRNLHFSFTSPGQQQNDSSISDQLQRFSMDSTLVPSGDSSDQDTACGSCCELIDSPLSATGREDELGGPRMRISRTAENATSSDLEAQH